MPDGYLVVRHPAFVRFLERAKLRSCAENAAVDFLFVSVPQRAPLNTLFSHHSHQ
jgi:hypothetical protein